MAELEERELDELRDVHVGDTRILRAMLRLGRDADGEPAYFLELLLTNPPVDDGTWPVEDVWELRNAVRNVLLHRNLDLPWFLSFAPEDEGELEPDDVRESVDV